MAQNIVNINQIKTLNALDTYNHTALTNNMYKVDCSVLELPPSGVIIQIKQNGTIKATTSTPPAASQMVVNLQIVLNCAANDLISVVLSSAQASDTGLNVIKGALNIHIGST
jgi:hypothetical protein